MEARQRKQEQEVQKAISETSDHAQQIDAIAKIRAWFRPKDDSTFYPLIQSYLGGRADLEATIADITKPIDSALAADRVQDIDLLDFWYSILHSAKRIPSQFIEGHVKLVELVRAFQDHPGPAANGQSSIYTSLRDFGMAAREVMNDSPGVGAGYTEPENFAYTSLNFFFARITREGLRDFWLYCIWEMRAALEDVPKDDGPHDAHKPGTAMQKYEARVPAAAAWVMVLGEELYEKEEDLTPTSPNQGNPARGGELWTGKAEFSKARWALWKKRFGEISDLEGVRQEIRTMAKQAVDIMNESEKA